MGSYAVGGNTDTLGWQRIFDDMPITSFVQTRSCRAGELRVTGLSINDSFDTRLEIPQDPQFHIVVDMVPTSRAWVTFEPICCWPDTPMAGQVQLPFIGPLITLSQVPLHGPAD